MAGENNSTVIVLCRYLLCCSEFVWLLLVGFGGSLTK
jgi:hypothetical protein